MAPVGATVIYKLTTYTLPPQRINPTDDGELYFAQLLREHECEAEALRRWPADAILEWQHSPFAQPASDRLLGLLDTPRTFSSHAARDPLRLVAVRRNALRIARRVSSAGFRAGADQLARTRETVAQLPRRLLKSVVDSDGGSGSARGPQTRRMGAGIKPSTPVLGHRGR